MVADFRGANQLYRRRMLVQRLAQTSLTITAYSTVTDFARFLGLSTSVPRAQAV